jgi:hypothetical protein
MNMVNINDVAQAATLEDLKAKRNQLMRDAEKAAYEYFCECEVGREREKAHEIYENLRHAGRVY